MPKKVFICLFACLSTLQVLAQPDSRTIDSLLNTLSLDEKIGQLFMVPIFIGSDRKYRNEIEDMVKSHHVGGIVVMDGSLTDVAIATREAQSLSAVPLFIGIDGTSGWNGIVDSTATLPNNLTLTAVANDDLVYAAGVEAARQMKLLGINMHFGPAGSLREAGQVNNESFSSDARLTARKTVSYMRGLEDAGIMAIAKGFPIGGITILEAKKGELPRIQAFIDTTLIYPYRRLFSQGASGVLPASSEFPLFYEKRKNIKRNVYSPPLLTSIYAANWMRSELKYNGLFLVSIPQIRSQTNSFGDGVAEALAFQAGNDIILLPEDLGASVRKIKRLLRKDSRYLQQLDQTVRKILTVKISRGVFLKLPPVPDRLYQEIHRVESKILNYRIIDEALTLATDSAHALPVKTIEDQRFLSIAMGAPARNEFSTCLSRYATIQKATMDENANSLDTKLDDATTVIVGLFREPTADDLEMLDRLATLQSSKTIILCPFVDPGFIPHPERFRVLLFGYQPTTWSLSLMAQKIFGALTFKGQVPVTLHALIPAGTHVVTAPLARLGYSFPEERGVSSQVLERIHGIAEEAIRYKATPGCNVLVARDGKVIYEKSFGYLSYDSSQAVTDSTVYDLASVTKVAATLQAVMFLYDRGQIDIHRKVSYYLPELKNSNKKDFTIKDVLTHQAGLWPFLPFWAQTMNGSQFLSEYYSQTQDEKYSLQVADHLYTTPAMRDSLWQWIIKAKIRDKPLRTPYDYRYSDMGFYMMQHLAEKMLNQPLEDFLQQNLYEPLGSLSTGFLPRSRFPLSQIAPTEYDTSFRKTLLVGTVHDQGAAMHGGVAGHAGLFSNANDLAKVGQMLLQNGTYGGVQYYRPETVSLFTRKQYDTSRRGLGWDKPVQSDWNSPTSLYASPSTFGHTGFTGTCVWVDPEFGLVYVFLSNRVHPDMNNNKLLSANIRSRIQDTIYQAIFSYCGNPIEYSAGESFNLSRR
jgi:CubicO group peptidase (beta-lactamase class C family)/beta-glucosidase-like glycosyl hydrolase